MLNILFKSFSFLLLVSSLTVVITNNPVVSVLFLVLSFLFAALLLILLECEFLALMLLIIYVGAVAILFIFVLMMLDIKLKTLNKNIFIYFPFGIFLNSIFFCNLVILVLNNLNTNFYLNNFFTYISWYALVDSILDITVIGNLLYTHFVLQFLLIGFILFLALVGVVFLIARPVKNYKTQSVFCQVSRSSVLF